MSVVFLTIVRILNDMNKIDQPIPQERRTVRVRDSLRTKFLIAFVSAFSITFLMAGIIGMYGLPFRSIEGWRGSAQHEAIRSLNLVADLTKSHLMTWFRERLGDAQIITENQSVQAILPALSPSDSVSRPKDKSGDESRIWVPDALDIGQAASFLSSVKIAYANNRTVRYQDISIVDIESRRVLVSTKAGEAGLLSIHQESIEAIIRTRTGYVSDVSVAEHAVRPHFAVGYPIFDATETIRGVVVLEVELQSALGTIRNEGRGLGSTREILVVNAETQILTKLRHPLIDGSQADVLKYKITAIPAVLAASGHEGTVASTDYRGQEVIAAYRHIRVSPDWGWGLVVKVDKAQLFSSMNVATRFSAWIGATGVLLIAILSLILTRQLIEPLSMITRVATRLAAGERFERTALTSHDEIGALSSAFDNMVEKLDSTNRSLLHRSAELDTVNKELESFAYAVAHDLRAPLRAIDGFSQALIEDYGDSLEGEAISYLGYLREGSQEMGRLIDDLLKLSRATRGEMVREDIDLSKMATEIVEELRSSDPERNVKTTIAPGVLVSGDARLLRVVMDNLLANAWKFSSGEAEARIEFEAERLNGKLRCVIRDNGAGFDMAYESKLFSPFQRLHSNQEFDGTGIGLVTVQRIIHRHGGTIQAKGIVGEGASFIFELDAGENDHG